MEFITRMDRFQQEWKMDLYENPKAPLEERVQDLLSQMTLEEKVARWLPSMVQDVY